MPAHPLRLLTYRGHLDLDRPWADIAAEAEAAVLRQARPDETGLPCLTALGAALALGDVERAMARNRWARAAVILGAQDGAGRLGEGA